MKVSDSQLRPLLIIKEMKGRSFTGISNVELANKLKTTPSSISRSINVLVHAGFVEQLSNGLYALSTEILNIATHHAREVQTINAKLAEINQ